MSGAGTYTVGRTSAYTTLQAALDQLFIDQGSTTFTATQTIIVYPVEALLGDIKKFKGARVPVGLHPTDTYRLVIQSGVPLTVPDSTTRGQGRPMLYGKTGTVEFDWAGIYVDQVDYVDVRDFDIQEFKSGIIYYRSDYGRVIGCRLYKNNIFGIQFFESNRCAVVNTSFHESSMLISMIRSRELILIHNFLYTGDAHRFCINAEWIDGDIGSSSPLVQSIPIYYAYNNIFYAGEGAIPVIVPLDIQKTLRFMDGNIYYSPSGTIADIYYIVEGKRVDTMIKSMTEWRRVTVADSHSMFSADGNSGIYGEAGLVIEDSSGILNGGISLTDIRNFLPSWFSFSIVEDDAGGNPRDGTPTPTPGPIEIITGDDYDIFTDFLGSTSDLTVDDDDKIFGVDRAVRQLQLSLECWSPNVAAGYFYVGDAAYYLYASKFGTSLRDVTYSRVDLTSEMDVISVSILDTSEDDDATPVEWFKRGKTVWARHKGATFSRPITESVRVYGIERAWDSSDQAFDETTLSRYFSVKDSPSDFFLDPGQQGSGPIVITDDTLVPEPTSTHPDRNDRSLVPFEYKYEWDASLEKPRLKLQGATNLFENPHLHHVSGTTPVAWGFGTVVVNADPSVKHDHQVIGRSRASVICSTSYDPVTSYAFRQYITRHDIDADLVLSWYMRSDSGLSVKPVITTYRANGSVFEETILDTIVSPRATSDIEWDRYVVHCKADTESALHDYGLEYTLAGNVDISTSSSASSRILFELRAAGLGTSEFDAFMAFEGDYVPRYAGLSYGDEITVEYDTSDSGLYNIDDLSISPILNPQHSGFLVIGPVPIEDLDTSVLEVGHTSLSDTYKPMRLRGLPWAKIDGPNKWRHVSSDVFSLESQGLPREVGFTSGVPLAASIDVYPNPVVVAQGLRQSFQVSVRDTTKNPYAHKDVDISLNEDDGHYTGSIGIREMGSPSQLGVSVSTKSDPSGSVVATLIAPDKGIFLKAFDTSDLYPQHKVSVYYKPNIDKHANVSLYRAVTNERINTYGTFTSEVLTPVESGRNLEITLTEYPMFTTLSVQVDGTSEFDVDLFETLNEDFGDNEFLVDYATGKVSYRNSRSGTAKASYVPMYVWIDSSDPNSIQFHNRLISTITSDMFVQYDVMSEIDIVAGSASLTVPVVLLNPDA